MNPTDVLPIWQHLPFHRGYPVPYFVHWDEATSTDGAKVRTPNFHRASGEKWRICLQHKKCWVCGRKLNKVSYLVAGPKGITNRVTTDLFMHEACARASLRVCPHLYYQKTARRDLLTDELELIANPDLDTTKPLHIALVKTGAYQIIWTGQTYLVNYQPLRAEWFTYQNGILTPTDEQPVVVNPTGWKTSGCGIVPLSKL